MAMANLANLVPADSVKHYQDWIARLNAVPTVIDQIIGVLRQGEKDKLMPPKFLLEQVVVQCRSLAKVPGMQNPFAKPLAKFPKTILPAEQQRLRAAMIAAVNTKVRPAYRKLADFIATDYAPAGRTEAGIWALPNGKALYRYLVRTRASTEMSPDQIHQLGLDQVAKIEKEEAVIARKLGFQDLKSFRESLKTDPKLYPTSREEILDLFRKYVAQMRPELPKLFGTLLPKAHVKVLPIPRFEEKGADVAEYFPGTPDGSRPGIVYVNTGNYRHRSMIMFEDIAYHEGIPGHHLQISIAQEIPGLPPFRKHLHITAYIEGWGLYAEQLGKEVGFYQNPYSDFGRLNGDLERCIRLVEDTGINWDHWTRERAIQYFHAHSGLGDPIVQMEVDRYMVLPGQALAYKIGELKFLELRKRAKEKLGSKFNIRAFHDEMLNAGPLPLDVLDARTNEWIARVKAGKDTTEP